MEKWIAEVLQEYEPSLYTVTAWRARELEDQFPLPDGSMSVLRSVVATSGRDACEQVLRAEGATRIEVTRQIGVTLDRAWLTGVAEGLWQGAER